MKDESRRVHWSVKLLLTVIVGSLLAVGATFLPADRLEAIIPRPTLVLLCVGAVVGSTIVVPTILYRREHNDWRRSVEMGVAIGFSASAIILVVGLVCVGLILARVVNSLPT